MLLSSSVERKIPTTANKPEEEATRKPAAGFYLPTFSDSDDEEENGAGLIIDLGGGGGGGGEGGKESSAEPFIDDDGIVDDVGSNADGPCKLNEEGVTVFVCVHCDQTFETMHARRKHILTAHDDVGGKIDCDLCQKNFNTRSALAMHKKSAHAKVRPTCVRVFCRLLSQAYRIRG